jgi:hypothetical protein
VSTSVGRDFATLLGLRSQADYNRHFLLDAPSINEEMARVDAMFELMGAFITSHGISLPTK